ncbi:MAG TPA: DUF1080 domain-containing protein [bacterium]|nr:DUF1080 domain-containing protein [bacterium]
MMLKHNKDSGLRRPDHEWSPTGAFVLIGLFLLLSGLLVLPLGISTHQAAGSGPEMNALTAREASQGWRLLFDGETFNGWIGVGRTTVPAGIWVIEDGAIKKVARENYPRGSDGESVDGGNLRTSEVFQNFEFSLEWKVAPGTNSGIKYNVFPGDPGRHNSLGFEYQILDDASYADLGILHKTGALYELYPPSDKKQLRPAGEYNQTRILLNGTHGEHWLNGEKIVEYEIDSQTMRDAFAESKWSGNQEFLNRRVAPLVFQDHGGAVWYRNIKIRPLPAQ